MPRSFDVLRLPHSVGKAEAVRSGMRKAFQSDAEFVSSGMQGESSKGATPSDLPVEQSTKFELVINLKTAKALGLTNCLPTSAQPDFLSATHAGDAPSHRGPGPSVRFGANSRPVAART
jgi:hypothetical protein